ncbi:MAG: hypothetical protein R3B45_17375 [Bdellovibrionota bacterium]
MKNSGVIFSLIPFFFVFSSCKQKVVEDSLVEAKGNIDKPVVGELYTISADKLYFYSSKDSSSQSREGQLIYKDTIKVVEVYDGGIGFRPVYSKNADFIKMLSKHCHVDKTYYTSDEYLNKIEKIEPEKWSMPKDFKKGEPFSVIRNPAILEKLERNFSLSRLINPSSPIDVENNCQFYSSSNIYKSVSDHLIQDLDDLIIREKPFSKSRGSVDYDSFEGKPIRRVFLKKWFSSVKSKYELVGIVNRIDRMAFRENSCGEVRFIYRMSYREGLDRQDHYSRLPITVNLVFNVPMVDFQDVTITKDQCKKMVYNWSFPEHPSFESEDGFFDYLVSDNGPLGPQIFDRGNLSAIEVNLQSVRTPSGARTDFAGQGEYFLRAYKIVGDGVEEDYLENTPDVKKINNNPDMKSKLIAYINENINYLNAGILKLPVEFLTKKVSSFSAYGIARAANRLFDQIISPDDITDEAMKKIDRRQFKYVKSKSAAIRRLNDLTCVGCHQGRATAGFHFLGIDKSSTHATNSLFFEGSGHFSIELKRRYNSMKRVLHHQWMKPSRDFSIAPPEGELAGIGHFCGLPGSGDFAHWQCQKGLECTAYDEAEGETSLGKCTPPQNDLRAGDYCRVGEVSQPRDSDGSLKEYSYNFDGLGNTQGLRCGGHDASKYKCRSHSLGHPAGNCARDCKNLIPGREVCSSFIGGGFTDCISDPKTTFTQCIEKAASPGARGICNEERPCRNDFVCVKTSDASNGACMPSYFVFQVRLDGHPVPKY